MPELPEVETTRRGLRPSVLGALVLQTIVREPRLRWPIPGDLAQFLQGKVIQSLERRGKYLLFGLETGTLLVHLGMSGSLRIVVPDKPPAKHDHIDLRLSNNQCLRFRDPRRFGTVLWTADSPEQHPLLAGLGPEPLGPDFTGDYLYRISRGRSLAIKSFLMDGKIVAGIGNIYANEALFMSHIHPGRAAGRISPARYERLAWTIREVLDRAIADGGTTLRDFLGSDGEPGYFKSSLHVYNRAGAPCLTCGTAVLHRRLGQRSTFYCWRCQH